MRTLESGTALDRHSECRALTVRVGDCQHRRVTLIPRRRERDYDVAGILKLQDCGDSFSSRVGETCGRIGVEIAATDTQLVLFSGSDLRAGASANLLAPASCVFASGVWTAETLVAEKTGCMTNRRTVGRTQRFEAQAFMNAPCGLEVAIGRLSMEGDLWSGARSC